MRVVAFCKFAFIIFATAHWLGCIFYYLASHNNFNEDTLNMNWVTAWVEQSWVDYTWYKATGGHMYTVILFKGFALLTNMGYEDEVHTRAPVSRFCANLQLCLSFKSLSFHCVCLKRKSTSMLCTSQISFCVTFCVVPTFAVSCYLSLFLAFLWLFGAVAVASTQSKYAFSGSISC